MTEKGEERSWDVLDVGDAMVRGVARRYKCSTKHKERRERDHVGGCDGDDSARGTGTGCPPGITHEQVEVWLQQATPQESGGRPKLWVHVRGWVFVAQETHPGQGVYHGYPEIGQKVPRDVMEAWRDAGVDRETRRRIREQLQLPEKFPDELD